MNFFGKKKTTASTVSSTSKSTPTDPQTTIVKLRETIEEFERGLAKDVLLELKKKVRLYTEYKQALATGRPMQSMQPMPQRQGSANGGLGTRQGSGRELTRAREPLGRVSEAPTGVPITSPTPSPPGSNGDPLHDGRLPAPPGSVPPQRRGRRAKRGPR